MGDILALSELKTKARITGTQNDAELTQIIAEVENKFQGEIGQMLISQNYTEVRTGDGTQTLQLYRYPIVSVASIAIEGESNVTLTSDHIRYTTGAGSDGILSLLHRYFTRWYPQNVTVTYTAGFSNQAAIKAAMPDAWEVCLSAASQFWFDMKSQEKGVASQAYMDGAISYIGPQFTGEKFQKQWSQAVQKYRRRKQEAVVAI